VLLKLKNRAEKGLRDSTRDMLTLAQYAQKLRRRGSKEALKLAFAQVLEKAGE
jgi:hypothetical protein